MVYLVSYDTKGETFLCLRFITLWGVRSSSAFQHLILSLETLVLHIYKYPVVVFLHTQVTQEISDPSRVFRLLGSDRLVQIYFHL